MRATGVLVRFLSLLDVALILLGVLMIALMHAQVRSAGKSGQSADGGLAEVADVNFVYLYAGWRGTENGKCFVLGPNREVGREIGTTSADDVRQLLASRPGESEPKNSVVMLLFSDDGWYSAWDAAKLVALETAWNVKVVPVYNVRLHR